MTPEQRLKAAYPEQDVRSLFELDPDSLHECYEICRDLYDIQGHQGHALQQLELIEAILKGRSDFLARAQERNSRPFRLI